MDIETYQAKYNELQAQIKEHGKTMLLAGFKQLFEAVPELEAVRWQQYTPHFNDGDPCTFRMGEFGYKFAGVRRGEDEEDEDEDAGGFIDYCYDKSSPWWPLWIKTEAAVGAAKLNLLELEGVYEDTFGDGYRVTISRDLTVESEEYDHD